MNNATRPTDINGNSYNRNLLVLVLMVGSFCTFLNSTLMNTAFPAIMKDFSITTATVQWLTTGFMMVNGGMIPISAWLINRFSSKTMYLWAMLTFLLGTVVSFTAQNFGILLLGRLIQGIGVGVSMPLLQTIMLSIFPPEKRGAAMGTVGLVIGLAPALGPTLSGWIVDNWTWRELFGMIIPIVVAVIILAFFFMKSVVPNTHQKIDVISIITSTIGFGALLYGFSKAGNDGWGDLYVLVYLAVGAVFVALFCLRQLKMDEPFLDITVFKYGEFSLAAILSGVANLALVGSEMVIPLYIQNIRGESAFHSGLILLPGALAMGIMSPITGRLFDRYGAKFMALAGMTMLTLGSIPFLFITKETSIMLIIVFYAIRMFGISATMMPVTTSGMNVLPFNKISHGTAVNNTFRQVLSSIGTAILISVLSSVTKNSMPAHNVLVQTPIKYADLATGAVLNGYHAAFFISILFAVVALCFAFFLKKGNNAPKVTLTSKKGAK